MGKIASGDSAFWRNFILFHVNLGGSIIGTARFLRFLIKSALIPICSQFNPRQPRRRPAHLLTNGIEVGVLADLDDKFVVYMADDAAVGQRPHGVAQDVPTDCLGDVLAKLRSMNSDRKEVSQGENQHS